MNALVPSRVPAKSIAQAEAELQEATRAFDDAKAAEDAAVGKRQTARSRMNDAQKAFDDAVEAVRAAHAPRDSDWAEKRRRQQDDALHGRGF